VTDAEYLDWLKEKNFISAEEAFKVLRGKITRSHLREIWTKYRNWKTVQPYDPVEMVRVSKDFLKGRETHVLLLDLEVSPILGTTYEAYKSNLIWIEKPPMIVTMAWQWFGEDEIHVKGLPDYDGYKPGWEHLNDRDLCEELYDLLEKADLIVGHNEKKFDLTIARSRFLAHGFRPTKEWFIEDTLQILWKRFRLPKNNLEAACEYVGLPGKTKFTHADFIKGCIAGNKEDWEGMKTYNARDIEITKAFYAKISPWNNSHANLNLILRGGQLCRVCLANGRTATNVAKNGTEYLKMSARAKYRCLTCGFHWKGEVIARARRPEPVEIELERVEQFNV